MQAHEVVAGGEARVLEVLLDLRRLGGDAVVRLRARIEAREHEPLLVEVDDQPVGVGAERDGDAGQGIVDADAEPEVGLKAGQLRFEFFLGHAVLV